MLGSQIINDLLRPEQKTLIYELEFLAVAIAWLLWKERLTCATVMFFIDNNGVKDSTIKGKTDNLLAELLLETILNIELAAHSIPWYARVPSASNPSDSLSRGQCDGLDNKLEIEECVRDSHVAFILSQWAKLSSDDVTPMG